jgi:hypothetical protein
MVIGDEEEMLISTRQQQPQQQQNQSSKIINKSTSTDAITTTTTTTNNPPTNLVTNSNNNNSPTLKPNRKHQTNIDNIDNIDDTTNNNDEATSPPPTLTTRVFNACCDLIFSILSLLCVVITLGIGLYLVYLLYSVISTWWSIKRGSVSPSDDSENIKEFRLVDDFTLSYAACSPLAPKFYDKSKPQSTPSPSTTPPLLTSSYFIHNICFRPQIQTRAEVVIALDLDIFSKPDQPPSRLILVNAMFEFGSLDYHGQQTVLLHTPATTADENLFRIDLSPDRKSAEWRRARIGIRAVDEESLDSTRRSSWSAPLAVMDVAFVDDRHRLAWVDITNLLDSSLFVIDYTHAAAAPENLPSPPVLVHVNLKRASTFPSNVILHTDVIIKSPSNVLSPSVDEYAFRIEFSLFLLPQYPAIARETSFKVGYFETAFNLVGPLPSSITSTGIKTYTDRISVINRRVQESTFTFLIDPSVPTKWRSAVRRGVLNWNTAFEKIGSKKRVRVILPSDMDTWPDDYDAGDTRFTSISWVVSLVRTFAYGPSEVDPRSGEILNSKIIITHAWFDLWLKEIQQLKSEQQSSSSPHGNTQKNKPRIRRRLHQQTGQFSSSSLLDEPKNSGDTTSPPKTTTKDIHNSGGDCDKQRHNELHRQLASLVLGIIDPNDDEEMTRLFEMALTDVVQHEVGHALGLRHNFKGSLARSKTDLKRPDLQSVSASVMDYVPMNIYGPILFSTTIGEYDVEAIRYGYGEFPVEQMITTQIEDLTVEFATSPALVKVATNVGPFSSDEDDPSTMGWDPTSNAFDLSSNPLDYHLFQIEKITSLQENPPQSLGEDKVDSALQLFSLITFHIKSCIKYIGGISVDRTAYSWHHISDELQSQALLALIEVIIQGTYNGKTTFLADEHRQFVIRDGGVCQQIEQWCLGAHSISLSKIAMDTRISLLGNVLNRISSATSKFRDEFITSMSNKVLSEILNALWGEENQDGQIPTRAINTNEVQMALQYRWTEWIIDSGIRHSVASFAAKTRSDANLIFNRLSNWLQHSVDVMKVGSTNNDVIQIDTVVRGHWLRIVSKLKSGLKVNDGLNNDSW